MYFYRTKSGLEVDLVITSPKGVWGCEIKNKETVSHRDSSGLRKLAHALGSSWRGGMVIYRGDSIADLGNGIWAVPAFRLLG
ncbi:MAG: hypothetical protein DWQ10_15490 [Calditrichaeota bacterium]|nr:MAG: hypothetical protein DWQ10_15490 [Calditrichota bacterium]